MLFSTPSSTAIEFDSAQLEAPATARRRRSLPMLVVALLVGLLGSLLVVASPASAAPAYHYRTATENSISYSLKRALNDERRAHGLAPLYMNTDLMHSARMHDWHMVLANTMSHQLPGEASFGVRMEASGYNWTWAGENIAWSSNMSTAGVLQLEQLMYAERAPYDGHRLNILGSHYTNIGIDIYMDWTHHKVWLTTDFGRR